MPSTKTPSVSPNKSRVRLLEGWKRWEGVRREGRKRKEEDE